MREISSKTSGLRVLILKYVYYLSTFERLFHLIGIVKGRTLVGFWKSSEYGVLIVIWPQAKKVEISMCFDIGTIMAK